MPTDLSVEAARSAVLSMDLQAGVVAMYVKDDGFIRRAGQVLEQARRAGLTVIHVKVGFRPGLPEASPRNVFLSTVKASIPHQRFFQNESGAIHAGVSPAAHDLLVTKNRVSAFAGTDLDLLLRAKDIHTLIVFGIATSGVVLSTVLQAADMDYRVIVIGDCCTDPDQQVHDCVLSSIVPRQATVATAVDVLNALVSLF
jgi:nicotinamidase-related amidase